MSIDPSKPASAFVFKTQIDQFSGRLSYIKAITGTILSDMDMVVSRDLHKERIGKLFTMQGKKLEEISSLPAGDIGVLAKISSLKTNDTIIFDDNLLCTAAATLSCPYVGDFSS